jgi:hypothetical protein
MFLKVWTTLGGNDEKSALSRREILAGIGLVGACAAAFPSILGSKPAEALEVALLAPLIPDATRTEIVEVNAAQRNSETEELTEFSSQDWRRRRRRRWREVCTTHWRRGRRVRVCRRVY